VFGMLERGGELRTRAVDRLGQARDEIAKHVERGSNVMTDDWGA